MFGKHKHKDPLSFDIVKDLQTYCLQDFEFLPMLHVPFRKMKKKTYMIIIKASIFPTNGKLKNVCMIKLPPMCHVMDASDKWGMPF